MARKEVLDRAGWFDERYFMYAEDVDLCRTVLDQGCKLYYLSTAEIIHVAGGTTKKAPSGFSVLMKCESIAKLMRKHYGSVGSLAYRLEIASGSLASLLALTILRGVCTVLPVRTQIRFTDSLFKHRLALLWSLGLRKPFVAQHPPEHGIPTELQATGSTIYEAPSN
jgi:GT2 family glycosyltransferase